MRLFIVTFMTYVVYKKQVQQTLSFLFQLLMVSLGLSLAWWMVGSWVYLQDPMELQNLNIRKWRHGLEFDEALRIYNQKEGEARLGETQDTNGITARFCPPKAYFENSSSKINCSEDAFHLSLKRESSGGGIYYSFLEKLGLAFKNSTVIPWLILEQDVLSNETSHKKDESRLFWILDKFPRVLSLLKRKEDFAGLQGLFESQQKWLRKGHEWETLILSPLNPKRKNPSLEYGKEMRELIQKNSLKDLLKDLLKRRIGLFVSDQSEMYSLLSKHLFKVPLLYLGANATLNMSKEDFRKWDLINSSSTEALYFPLT